MRYRANGGFLGPALTTNTAFASGMWSMPEFQQKLGAGTWPTDQTATFLEDVNFEYVTMLLKSVGANTAQNYTFLDSSTNNFTVTRNGDVTQGAFSPHSQVDGYWSSYFDGTGDYLTVPYSTANFDWWTSDYTIECWIFPTTLTGWTYNTGVETPTLIGNMDNASTTDYWSFGPLSNGTVRFYYYNGSAQSVTSTSTVSINQWNHIAMTKTSSGITIYVNGVASSTTTVSGTPQSSATYPLTIGRSNATAIAGYVSNIRIVKGTAIYTSSFTSPTNGLTAISGTKLLTCQSNQFKDNSTSALTVTRNGDSKISSFGPFNPGRAYSALITGGSYYFDGTGDYMTAGSAVSLSGDFTVEGWVYCTSYSKELFLYCLGNDYNSTGATFFISTNGYLRIYTGNAHKFSGTTGVMPLNSWNHVAFVRSSGTVKGYLNGVEVDSASSWTNTLSGLSHINAELNGVPGTTYVGTSCYISDLRVGTTAVYTTSFTPSTTPLTTASGTSILMSGTNAGIIDASRKVNLYTVGNAQVSTSTVKYDKSTYFDGTGDYVYVPASEALKYGQFGTGDFTVEAWINFSALASNRAIIDAWVSGQSASWQLYFSTSTNKIRWYVGASTIVESTTTPTTGTWYHVAVCRSGTTIRLFINGTLEATTLSHTTNYNYSAPIAVGVQYSTLTNYLQGYIEDVRITSGYARYTANFTAPNGSFNTL